MGDFKHGRIQWKSIQSSGSEDQKFLNLVQDSCLTQHVLEPTQIYFIINVKGEQNRKIRYRKYFHKVHEDIKDMRKHLAKIDWNNTLENKTATECWNILKREIVCIVEQFVPLK